MSGWMRLGVLIRCQSTHQHMSCTLQHAWWRGRMVCHAAMAITCMVCFAHVYVQAASLPQALVGCTAGSGCMTPLVCFRW
jgi:hypothetical protein